MHIIKIVSVMGTSITTYVLLLSQYTAFTMKKRRYKWAIGSERPVILTICSVHIHSFIKVTKGRPRIRTSSYHVQALLVGNL